ncbi:MULTISPECIES: Lrp/AsnC family transcriptional regulator [Streptomyces]|uniref:Lrp/AsnC family transcriptional regulator n=2 Tax=Streptomyces TaxID=1883 RepID=UPI0012396F01|nr:Lrp/AsnC family transcriptional regulator [Streptomyces venezuelae]MYZ17612.1 AsnC family transcriptional regulator [Streptomyces sp. SID337]NEB45919.1 Lrp/AsnC family transcriptional regulator [Streptomyces sp. SID339]
MRTHAPTGGAAEPLAADPGLDGLDLRIVSALQIEPRASWAKVGSVLGVDAVTVARRWNRLRAAGLAWVTAYEPGPAQGRLAVVEVECAGNPLEVADSLVGDQECQTLDLASGGRDLLVGVCAHDEVALADYLLKRLGTGPQIRAVRTQLVTSFVREAGDWRLGELPADQAARFTEHGAREPGAPVAPTGLERAVLAALREDGRMPATTIAARTDVPVRRAREVVQRLLRHRRVALWTDVARAKCGRSVQAWFFLQVPARRLAGVAARLARLDEARLVVTTVGTYNLAVCVWMRELADVTRLEARIEDGLEGVRIADRCITLRTAKRAGNLLDAQGRRTVRAS